MASDFPLDRFVVDVQHEGVNHCLLMLSLEISKP